LSYIATKNDFGILRQDGTTKVGFMLYRDEKTRVPAWSEAVDEYLAQQQTQEAGYSGLPYEKEIKLIQSDWRAGFGQEIFDPSDPTRYNYAVNMDMRHRGMAILGNGPTTATVQTALSWSNTDFENWTGGDPDDWDVTQIGAVTHSEENVVVNSGSASLEMTDAAVSSGYIYQDAANWDNDYRGATIKISMYIWADNANVASFSIEDGVGETNSGLNDGDSDWDLETVTHTFDVAATRCRIKLNYAAVAGVQLVRFDGAMTLPAQGTVRMYKQGLFNDDEYFSCGTYLMKIDNSDGLVYPVGLLPATITCVTAFTDDKLYISLGASDYYWYMTTAEVFTESDSTAHLMCAVGTTMWKSLQPRSIYSATDPTADANWSAATTVDSSANNIVDLLTFDNTLYIRKDDRPFFLDSGGAVNTLTNITTSMTDSITNQNTLEWQGSIYFPWGPQGLLEYDSVEGTFTWRDPALYVSRQNEFGNVVKAMAADSYYLYAILLNEATTGINILAGRTEEIEGSYKWAWHTMQTISLTGIETAKASSVYQERLYVTGTSSVLKYVPLVEDYACPESDTNRDFQNGGYFITTWLHGGFADDTKGFIKATAHLGHTYNANYYFECWYKKLEDAVWTDAGDFKGTSSSRIATLFLPVDGSGNKPSSRYIQFKLVGKTSSTTNTPILLSFTVQAMLFPPQRKIISCVVRVGKDIKDKMGQNLEDGVTAQKAALDELVTTPTWPFTIYDVDGTTRYMRLLPSDPFKAPVFDEQYRIKEWRYFLKMQEVALS
jgi:hypothetical protein